MTKIEDREKRSIIEIIKFTLNIKEIHNKLKGLNQKINQSTASFIEIVLI